jgi:hypothetical protein
MEKLVKCVTAVPEMKPASSKEKGKSKQNSISVLIHTRGHDAIIVMSSPARWIPGRDGAGHTMRDWHGFIAYGLRQGLGYWKSAADKGICWHSFGLCSAGAWIFHLRW